MTRRPFLRRAAEVLSWHRRESRRLDERIEVAAQQVQDADVILQRAKSESRQTRQSIASNRFSVMLSDSLRIQHPEKLH